MNSQAHPLINPEYAVKTLIPFVHVASVDSSLDFYALLGFVPTSVMKNAGDFTFWAHAKCASGDVMLARADGPIAVGQQAVLFYMHSDDVAELRWHLLACGLRDGGVYGGAVSADGARPIVYEVAHPHYMPAGEIRIEDPDGYVILVGQLK